jgi:hypothetical protein
MADALTALGLRTVGELLEHLPRASREARSVRDLRVGEGAPGPPCQAPADEAPG